MKEKIAIIGAGQTGLFAAHGLLKAGYTVTLYSDRSPEDYLHSRPIGFPGKFKTALDYERELGLNFWDEVAVPVEGVYFSIWPKPGNQLLTLKGRVRECRSIDMRLQCAVWLSEFARRQGQVQVEKITVPRLEAIAAENDLTVLATGKRDLCELFEKDTTQDTYDPPPRHLIGVLVHENAERYKEFNYIPVEFHLFPDWGEIFWMPHYHKEHKKAWSIIVEAIPGGPFDQFQQVSSGAESLHIIKGMLQTYLPTVWKYHKDLTLVDEDSWLAGKIPHVIRKPVGVLPSGQIITAIGDSLMTLDPAGAQGANNGIRMARNLIDCVQENAGQPFDAAWMERTFARFFDTHGRLSNAFNNLLLAPLTAAGKELVIAQIGSDGAADNQSSSQRLANAFVQNFENPVSLTPLLTDVKAMRAYIAQMTGRPWLQTAVAGRLKIAAGQIRQRLS